MTTNDDVKYLVLKYEEKETALKALCGDYDRLRASLIPADVQAALDDLAAEYGPKIASAQGGLDILESDIKALVLELGENVSGNRLKFRLSNGRETADMDMLRGMSALIPEIKTAFKTGNPSVSVYGKEKF